MYAEEGEYRNGVWRKLFGMGVLLLCVVYTHNVYAIKVKTITTGFIAGIMNDLFT